MEAEAAAAAFEWRSLAGNLWPPASQPAGQPGGPQRAPRELSLKWQPLAAPAASQLGDRDDDSAREDSPTFAGGADDDLRMIQV